MASGGEEPHPHKRRKVAESCKVCRTKKTRCDGQRPSCSPCVSKGIACEYSDATVPVSTSILSDIEARLRKLERQATATPAQSPAPNLVSNALIASSERSPLQAHSASIIGDPEETTQPFLDNQTTQYILDMTKLADSQTNGPLPQPLLWGRADQWPPETDTSSMVVPKRTIADHLVSCYEKFVYPLLPILHMPTFRRKYEHLWTPQGRSPSETLAAEATFHATLNIVFALGCINNSDVEPYLKLRTAEGFYRRSRLIMPLDALDNPSLEVVQYLLLTTNYLTFTKYLQRCCNTLAVAIRVAQTLGLHRDAESSSGNQLRREMSRRTWHLCITLERLVCTIFGRKTLVKTVNSVPLPAKIDDEYLLEDGTGTQPMETPPVLDALIVTIETFGVIDEANGIPYGTLTRVLRVPELAEILQLNEKIDKIEGSLPHYLKPGNDMQSHTPRDQVLMLQAAVVMTRIQHIRLVLLRPNVLAVARQSLLTPVPNAHPSHTETTLSTEVSKICLRAAISGITMLHANLHSASRIFSSNAVFVTLAAATVIITASLVPDLDVKLEDNSGPYGDAVSKALQVLEEHRWQVEGAPRAKSLLEKYMETVSEVRRRRDAANQDASGSYLLDGAQMSSGVGDISEFDFSDPLWDFQWGAPTPLFNTATGSLD